MLTINYSIMLTNMTKQAKVWQQHRVAKLLDGGVAAHKELQSIYQDSDDLKEEISKIKSSEMFKNFYAVLKETKEYHQKFATNLAVDSGPDIPAILDTVSVPFSGEEIFGKYLDLHTFYVQYCNIPNIPGRENQDYLQYLDKFSSFFYIPEKVKGSKAYKNYLMSLWEYLSGFFGRVQPLVNLDEIITEWKSSFETAWAEGKVAGWNKGSGGSGSNNHDGRGGGINKKEPQPLRLGIFNSAEELEALGLDRLKEALEAMGLKCGGSLKERAERLWSVRGKKPEDIPNKLKVNGKRKLEEVNDSSTLEAEAVSKDGIDGSASSSCTYRDWRKELAWTETRIVSLCEVMGDVVMSTRKHAEKQQTRTVEEKEAEILEEELGLLPDVGDAGDEDDKDDEGPIYNPLNIPLGWDGKPIPYWLYKLHGLGNEFKCEICGNQVYAGRRNFDRHFQEARHAHGMRCLGIPNTKHFHDIVLIEDALNLYAKIKGTLKTEQFVGEIDEEFEDTNGNVLNRRTYEDLARQGLL